MSGDERRSGSTFQSEVLEELTDAVHYRRWLSGLARPHLGEHPIEIGSGTGDYVLEWLDAVQRFTATESDESRLQGLQTRFVGHPKVTTARLALPDDLPERPVRHSAAVAYNVLEHISDDTAALAGMRELVVPKGCVVILAPAFPSAMSRFDRAIGHVRRYTKATLEAAFLAAGLEPTQVRYVNPIGLLNWYATVKVLGLTPANGPLVRAYDRFVVPIASRCDARRRPPRFGQSVFGVARSPS